MMLATSHDNLQRDENCAERCFLQGLKPDAGEHITWGLKPPSPKERRTFATRVALAALRFYKAYLSVLVGGTCRFVPSCSVYAYEAVERFGAARGSWLTLKRLLRCHPLSGRFGYDPVPDTWRDSPKDSNATGNEAHS